MLRRTEAVGLSALILSAFLFTACPPIAKTLYLSGWSAGSVLLVRLAACAIILLPPTLIALRGRWRAVRQSWVSILLYGAAGFAGMQGFFFLAIEHISVPLAQLIQMTAPVMIVFWLWARTRIRPSKLTFAGVAVSFLGLFLLLDPRGSTLDAAGIALAFIAAVCSVIYFLISAKQHASLPTIAGIGLGMTVGAVGIAVWGTTGALPFAFSTAAVDFLGAEIPWYLPLIVIVVFTVFAYVTGVLGLRLVGPTVGSFTSFSEVPFSVFAAWLLLAEVPDSGMIFGGLLILGGVAFVKWGETRDAR